MSDDVAAFLAARRDEDEKRARSRAARPARYTARILREIAADRALLAALERARQAQPVLGSYRDDPYEPAVSFSAGEYAGLMLAARLRAAVYRDHPGYRQEWSPAGAVFPPGPGDREGEQGDGEQAREHDRGT